MLKKHVDKTQERLNDCLAELRSEVKELEQVDLQMKDVFTLWFLRCEVVNTTRQANDALIKGPDNKGCDAIHVDDKAKIVTIVQTKYRVKQFGSADETNETLNDFFFVARKIKQSARNAFNYWLADNEKSKVNQRLKKVRKKIQEDGYALRMFFVTTGKCSRDTTNGIIRHSKSFDQKTDVEFHYLAYKDLDCLLLNYEDHVRPAITEIEIPVEDTPEISLQSYLQRIDKQNKIECWALPVNGEEMGDLHRRFGGQLFARNVRGYMGINSSVNKKMQRTLEKEPGMFFHYNNGITLVCDSVEFREVHGETHLKIKHPQIINGQQTTRTLGKSDYSDRASVLVKVIQLAVGYNADPKYYHRTIEAIVNATNSQTPVLSSHLRSNDPRQLGIQKALSKEGFFYLRKRELHQEATQRYGTGKSQRFVKKLDLAVAVASCERDQHDVRSGREKLFEGGLYKQVFPHNEPYYYLNRYFLWKEVKKISRGDAWWGYARAMVVNHVWKAIEGLLDSDEKSRKFVLNFFEVDPKYFHRVARAIDRIAEATFVEANKFYRRRNRKRQENPSQKPLDPSQFYRNRRGRNAEFEEEKKEWSKSNRKEVETGIVMLRKFLDESPVRKSFKVIDGL